MRQVVLFIATSLDGAIARADGRIDWLFTDDDYGFAAFLARVDVIVMGRATYDDLILFGGYPYGETPAYVFTHVPPDDPPDWPVRFVSGDPAQVVADLAASRAGDIWVAGGGDLNAQLLRADVIDKVVVSIHPLLIGQGRPLVSGEIPDRAFRLAHVESFETGLVQLTYDRVR
jgi:dihydrofolate reductase